MQRPQIAAFVPYQFGQTFLDMHYLNALYMSSRQLEEGAYFPGGTFFKLIGVHGLVQPGSGHLVDPPKSWAGPGESQLILQSQFLQDTLQAVVIKRQDGRCPPMGQHFLRRFVCIWLCHYESSLFFLYTRSKRQYV